MSNKSNFDAQVDRIQYLMGYDEKSMNESKKSNNVEFHKLGADNKVYGILKEGNMYYIKTTEQGKEQLAESYEYIGGYNYRNENGYKSYNEATKQLELKLISLNEAYGVHEDVSTVDFNRGRKTLATLTEAARKELDRMHQIFENSQTIGKDNTGDPESKGEASDPAKQGDPFEEPAKAELDKDFKETADVEDATDNTEVEGVEKDLESDAMKTKKVDPAEEMKDAHDDLEGEGVADQDPKGAKAVKMNESFDDDYQGDEEVRQFAEPELPGEVHDIEDEEKDADYWADYDKAAEEADLVGDDDETSLEDLLREFMDPSVEVNAGDIDADISALEEAENIEDVKPEESKEEAIVGPDEVLDGPRGGLDVQTDERINEAVDRIVENVCNKLCACEGNEGESGVCPKCGKKSENCTCKKVESLDEAITRIVKEEATKLNIWGKHPRYRKSPMTTPDNKEVAPNNAKDWNDDSAKGEHPYGEKIGDGAPFDKVVELILGEIKNQLKEGKLSKKA